MTIKRLPTSERPYEKLEMYGSKMLSSAELLAIIIKNGTKEKTAIDISNELLSENDNNNFSFLVDKSLEDLQKVKGIGKVKAIEIKAVCEIAKRMSFPQDYSKFTFKNPEDVATFMMENLRFEKTEKVKVLILNIKNKILKIIEVASGGTNAAYLNPKDVLIDAVKMGAPKIILVHNHPSGDSTPSLSDYEFTESVERAGKLLGIQLIDHIVVGNGNYKSIFRERNISR